jgi:hypothetical protein
MNYSMVRLLKQVPLVGLLVVSGLNAQAAVPAPSFKKVMTVIFENENASKANAQPGFSAFAAHGANLTNLIAETHPSQANYIALVSGDRQGVKGDASIDIDAKHIGDLLEGAGRSWKIYLEGYPGGCYTGTRTGDYVRKHNPFISFKNIQNDLVRCAKHLVPATELNQDIAAGTLPDYSIYVPDLKNDGHDTGVAYADRWFTASFVPLLSNPKFMRDMLVIATFDESGLLGGNKIYTALYGDSVIPGSTSAIGYDHYSLLRTIEETLGVGSLGLHDASSAPITGIWR